MARRRRLIDASNLHGGGGVQVASSVINEIQLLVSSPERMHDANIDVAVSSEVAANLNSSVWSSPMRVLVANSRPGRWASFPEKAYNSILTVFGPYYRPRRATREIVGFALGLLIYDTGSLGLGNPGAVARVQNRARWAAFGRADALITETFDSAARVHSRLPKARYHVVPNCVSRAVADRSAWSIPAGVSGLDAQVAYIAAIGRDYPHKNLTYLGPLGTHLAGYQSRRVQFIVTLTEREWAAKSPEFRENCTNFGILEARQLGPVYERCIATFCPSLLEISSATPLESLHLGVPVFAADVPYARATLGEVATLIDVTDPSRGALQLARDLSPDRLGAMANSGLEWASRQPSPSDRARTYLELLGASEPNPRRL